MVSYATDKILSLFKYSFANMNGFIQALVDPRLAPTAFKVSLIVGSILFSINHGTALAQAEMTRTRWLSGLITYLVPYSVNIHGQYTSRSRSSLKG